MYNFLKLFSFIVRNYCFPNPFARLEHGLIINIMFEPLLQFVTYVVVGMFYNKGNAPMVGSFLYLIFYALHSGLLIMGGNYNFSYNALAFIAISYYAFILILLALKKRLFSTDYF